MDAADAAGGGELRGDAGELERGLAGGLAGDGEVLPCDAAGEAGAERFHPGFLGGETAGEAFVGVGFGEGVADLGFGVDAVEKTVAEALAAGADAGDFREVGTDAENHGTGALQIHYGG